MASIRILAGHIGDMSGSSLYHHNLAKRLQMRGHKVSVLCFCVDPTFTNCYEALEIKCLKSNKLPLVWRFSYLIDYLNYHIQVERAPLPVVDLVIGGEHLLLRSHYSKFPEIPFIYLPHSLLVNLEIKSYKLDRFREWIGVRLYSSIQRWALLRATWVMRFTKKAGEVIQNHYKISLHNRLIINPIGVDLPSLPRSYSKELTSLRLLYVGRLVDSKNIKLVLKSLQMLRKYNWELNIVGGGPQEKELQKIIAMAGLEKNVHFRGHCSDVSKWYERSDLLVFPSKLESSAFVIPEAMSYGIPVLAMRSDGEAYITANEEFIQNDNTGWLADSENDFFCKLKNILENPNIIDITGMKARQFVEIKHNWERHLDQYEILIESIKKKRRLYFPI